MRWQPPCPRPHQLQAPSEALYLGPLRALARSLPPSIHCPPHPPAFDVPHTSLIVGRTHVGKTRKRNEDSLSLLPELGVAVVADGMGGHPGGHVASRVAAEAVTNALRQDLELARGNEADTRTRLSNAMRRSVMHAHEQVREEGRSEPDLEGMGTTLTALVVDAEADLFVIGHVGDSRAYRFRTGQLDQLSRDDTWVQERVDANVLTIEQARRHPFAHLLTQCVGLEDAPTPHIIHGSVEVGDVYLLCTDGLVGMVEDADLEVILNRELGEDGRAERGEPALDALLDAANEAGGFDNITAALLMIEGR